MVTASASHRRAFPTAEWRYLVMLNYDVDPAVLTPLVPPGTEIDSWHGRVLATLVRIPVPEHPRARSARAVSPEL